jgi:DtxR family Mn-dependent transcriptional regulator
MTSRREEDYLEAIDEVIQKKHYAKVNDVAKLLDIGLSSVTEMFQKLDSEGFLNYEKYSGVTLTHKGTKVVKDLKKKHDTLKEFLEILGIDSETADTEACKIEHVVDTETIQKLLKFVKFVKFQKINPRWLDHFKHYEDSGELIECTINCIESCPVHSKKSNK